LRQRWSYVDIWIRLSQIISNTLHELYGIRKKSLDIRLASAEKLNEAMSVWRGDIAQFLDLDLSMLSPLYRRQNVALRLSYSHALIFLHRPFLFDSFGNSDIGIPKLRATLEDNVQKCLDAALDVVKTIDLMYKSEKAFDASWVSNLGFICTNSMYSY
jgi:hypothetical protein